MREQTSWAKTQHYVPQFLLKNFATTGTEQVHVFDKREEKAFRAHVRKVAAENGLYDVKLPERIVSAETALSSLDGAAARVIGKILREQSLKLLTHDDRVVMSLFIGTQMLRVPHQVEIAFQLTEVLRKRFGSIDGMPETAEASRKLARESMVERLSIAMDLLPHLLNKTWFLLKADTKSSFAISDNPVTMHNIRKTPWGGSLGVAVKGIEIYLPLSAEITVALYCKSHEATWLRTKTQQALIDSLGIAIPHEFRLQAGLFSSLLQGIETGHPIQLTGRVIDFQNELQIWNSVRFVFSKTGDFDLARDAIKRSASAKAGPRLAGG